MPWHHIAGISVLLHSPTKRWYGYKGQRRRCPLAIQFEIERERVFPESSKSDYRTRSHFPLLRPMIHLLQLSKGCQRVIEAWFHLKLWPVVLMHVVNWSMRLAFQVVKKNCRNWRLQVDFFWRRLWPAWVWLVVGVKVILSASLFQRREQRSYPFDFALTQVESVDKASYNPFGNSWPTAENGNL